MICDLSMTPLSCSTLWLITQNVYTMLKAVVVLVLVPIHELIALVSRTFLIYPKSGRQEALSQKIIIAVFASTYYIVIDKELLTTIIRLWKYTNTFFGHLKIHNC
jgi:hypothetical protein